MDIELLSSSSGRVYVEEFINSYRDEQVRAKIRERLRVLKDFTFQELLRARNISKFKGRKRKLWEYIISFNKNEYRIFFVFENNTCYLVHASQKKDQRTRRQELTKAQDRAEEVYVYLRKE